MCGGEWRAWVFLLHWPHPLRQCSWASLVQSEQRKGGHHKRFHSITYTWLLFEMPEFSNKFTLADRWDIGPVGKPSVPWLLEITCSQASWFHIFWRVSMRLKALILIVRTCKFHESIIFKRKRSILCVFFLIGSLSIEGLPDDFWIWANLRGAKNIKFCEVVKP